MGSIASAKSLEQDRASLSQLLDVVENIRYPLWVFDLDNACVLWCNKSSLAVWGADSKDELLDRDMSVNMSLSVAKRLAQYKVDFTNNEHIQFHEIWTLHPNGEPTTFDMVFSCFKLDTGRVCMFCEVTNQSDRDPESLRSAEALLHTSVNISLYAATGEPLYRNPAARSNVHAASDTLEQHFSDLKIVSQLQNAVKDEVSAVTEVNTVNGSRWSDITARRCLDAVTGDAAWLISEVDVSRLKATEEQAQFLAEHDTLTRLPNRNYVSIYFQARIDRHLSSGKSGELIFIDLDNFKDVNDSLGHDAGDQLLIEVSERLMQLFSNENSVARLGGDEFLILLTSDHTKSDVEKTVSQLIHVISKPMVIQEREVQVTPSVGVALFPADGVNIRELMRHADLAMYHAKDIGKNNFSYFSKDLSDAVESRISLEAELRAALRNDEIVAYFQPRVDVANNIVVGAEALARWHHPQRGMIAPNVFIPVCEESGLITELGKFIFKQSVIAQRNWSEQGYDIRMSVNLSPLQFAEDELVDELIHIVESNSGNADRIELEITESVLLGNDQSTIDKLHDLVAYGFQISIDDFGTGYSSLAYLHRYPIKCLKIDRSFIQSMDTAKPIIELIISMAKLFGLYVVAEGVEEEQQLALLRTYQCHEYQGFLFEKPIELELFTNILVNQQKKVA